jgi:hypothetical protein
MADQATKRQELEELRARVRQLERELQTPPEHWQATTYYTAYYATTGFMLGIFGAATSLLFNVVGSLLWGQHPLKLIHVYLTFPLGEKALQMDDGLTLAIGCCLYLATGMLLGVPVYLALTRFTQNAGMGRRLIWATGLGLAIWLINFYGLLSWIQPLLFGGRWIVDQIPWWVGALTHIVFAWTLALLYPLGLYTPYRPQSER